MKKFKYCLFIAVIIIFLCLSGVVLAAEMCSWIDKNGHKVISNSPPPKGVKIIECEGYQPSSPEEIRAFERKQKRATERSESKRSVNRPSYDRVEVERAVRESKRDEEIAQKREELQKLQDDREYYRDRRRDARSQWGSNYWDKEVKYKDKEIEKKSQQLRDLEGNK